MPYAYSTLSNDQCYTTYKKSHNDMQQPDRQIIINGGAGMASKHLVTPRGVMTKITEEELSVLETVEVFRRHRENGFITIDNAKHDADDVAADMTGRDNSAPLVEQDFAEGSAPVIDGDKQADAEPAPYTPHPSNKRTQSANTSKRR